MHSISYRVTENHLVGKIQKKPKYKSKKYKTDPTSSWITDDHLVGRLKTSSCQLVHSVRLVPRLRRRRNDEDDADNGDGDVDDIVNKIKTEAETPWKQQ